MKYGASSVIGTQQSIPALETRPACLLEGISPHERDQVRQRTLENLHLLEAPNIPVFEEAAQTVSRLLTAPICLLSILDRDFQIFKAAVGLSSMGLMNQLAAAREIPRQESFCTHVVESGQSLILDDTTQHPAFSKSLLVQQYGIQAYLGVPLIAADGTCIGTLAVMDLMPRKFTHQEVAILELNARWSMSEYEKQALMAQIAKSGVSALSSPQSLSPSTGETGLQLKITEVRLDLISQLTQDLRNPLTAITGMANMLSREIYGPLTNKQQEYAKIVLDSSQTLLTLVDEIIELGGIQAEYQQLSVAPVDIEMLAQQSLQPLEKLAQQHDLNLNLTIEPGSRIWVLDKRIVKQLIYHLAFSLLKLSGAGSTVRIHISRKDDRLNIAFWVSNPWLGEDLPQAALNLAKQHLDDIVLNATKPSGEFSQISLNPLSNANLLSLDSSEIENAAETSRHELGLLLSRHLTKIHQGNTAIQGSSETGYRYVISLPSLKAT